MSTIICLKCLLQPCVCGIAGGSVQLKTNEPSFEQRLRDLELSQREVEKTLSKIFLILATKYGEEKEDLGVPDTKKLTKWLLKG